MMENFVYILQFLSSIAILASGITANIVTDLTCSVDSYRCSTQISDIDDVLSVDTLSSCDTCVLRLNTTNQHDIYLDIKSITNWKQLYHFYITYSHGQTTGLTGGIASPCTVLFPTNQLEIHYKMDATLAIGTRMNNPENGCSEKNNSPCKVATNCSDVIFFDDTWKVSYNLRYATYETDYFHRNIFNWIGYTDLKSYLPPCPRQCVCYLEYQVFVSVCNNRITRTLLLYPQFVPQIVEPIKVLDASHRRLETIAKRSFADLKYINRLILNGNLLEHIDSGTFNWYQLIILELADNKLTELQSDLFTGLYALVFLDIHGNQLTSLHPNLFIWQRFSFIALEASRNNLGDLSAETFKLLSNLRILILDKNNITDFQPGILTDLKSLWWLYLDENKLTTISPGAFRGPDLLLKLHLSGNQLKTIDPEMFTGAEELKELSLSRNELSSFTPNVFSNTPDLLQLSLDNNQIEDIDLQVFADLQRLLYLNISGNNINLLNHNAQKLTSKVSSNDTVSANETVIFPNLRYFDANDNGIERIADTVFAEMPLISAVGLRGNPLRKVDTSTFKSLVNNDTYVLVDEPTTCCFINGAQCKAENPRTPYLTCLRLLPFTSVRAFMWTFGLFAFVGNLSVLLWRCLKHGRENIVQVLLIENLAASDLLMGVYMLIIASADAYYRQYFPSESDDWRNGPICKLAGTISVLSSEASVFFITLISIDRFLSIKYPRGTQRLTKKSATISLICLWCFAFLLSIIPTSFSGVDPDFYDVSEVCIGLPFVRAPVFLNKTVVAVDVDLDDYNSISSFKDAAIEEDYIYPVT